MNYGERGLVGHLYISRFSSFLTCLISLFSPLFTRLGNDSKRSFIDLNMFLFCNEIPKPIFTTSFNPIVQGLHIQRSRNPSTLYYHDIKGDGKSSILIERQERIFDAQFFENLD
jgi:hypothetical protein